MRFPVFLRYSVRYLHIFLYSFAVLVPPLHPPQWRILVGFGALGIQTPKLFTILNVSGSLFLLLHVSVDISHGKFISRKSGHMHHTNFPGYYGKRVPYNHTLRKLTHSLLEILPKNAFWS